MQVHLLVAALMQAVGNIINGRICINFVALRRNRVPIFQQLDMLKNESLTPNPSSLACMMHVEAIDAEVAINIFGRLLSLDVKFAM